ncbi:flap endonuclease Xni [Leminorella grimontii]|uniref:Flap endonuclease Xni n=1 Tax=Leminorella grimontii TaxID=82981 RepID=A0AAV5N1F2_9GAMM|nr:flap endonuclease Xni [Leminorella grimontii]KFC97292.1 DNA polymerase I [Leminorella grimontii ATCC 33999 = DSM 5078]GKX55355.1 flap endonuclease Xni [Leminorella grimontii]VFS56482.1 Exonuclease IX [Leminorella grimontii]
MPINLLIVDALNLIRRIHAVQGSPCVPACVRALEQLIQHANPTHAVAVFDDEERKQSWRHRLYPNYKSGRVAMPESLSQELKQIEEAFTQSGVACWRSEGDEADDVVATLAYRISQQGHQVTIVSTDKGYCQLLAPTLRIRDYFQKRWLDVPFIEQEFGVIPAQLVDFWGLTGISSSKIPGVMGIGPKAAAAILNQFGTLEEAYRRIEEVPQKWRNKLVEQKEQAFLCRELAALKRDVPLRGNLQDLRFSGARVRRDGQE